MNCLRLSGSARPETCSADTVVPRITKMSTPASTTALAYLAVRCGDRLAAVGTPTRAPSSIRAPPAVHRAPHQRQLEPVGVALPGDRHLLRFSHPAGGQDADLSQRIAPAP